MLDASEKRHCDRKWERKEGWLEIYRARKAATVNAHIVLEGLCAITDKAGHPPPRRKGAQLRARLNDTTTRMDPV